MRSARLEHDSVSSQIFQLIFGFLIPALAAGAIGWSLRELSARRHGGRDRDRFQRRLEMAEHATQHAEELARELRSERSELSRRLSAAERELADRTRKLKELNAAEQGSERASRARYLSRATDEPKPSTAEDARLADAETELARIRRLLAEMQRDLTATTANNQLLQSRLRALTQNGGSGSAPIPVPNTRGTDVPLTVATDGVVEALQGDLAAAHAALCESDSLLVELRQRVAELETQLRELRGLADDPSTALLLAEKDRRISELSDDLQRLLRAHERVPSDRDDLRRIRGIGPKLAVELEQLGIRTYRQIARWSANDVDRIAAGLSVSAARIERDRWIAGAKRELQRKYEPR